MEIECPKCGDLQELDCEDLPADACDSVEYECQCCEHEFMIGWFAEVEIRNRKMSGNKR